MRPVLSPASPWLWRDPETLQLGGVGDRAVVLAGLDPPVRQVLRLLDGTRDLTQVEQGATAAGCPPDRLRTLLDLLTGAGLLVQATDPWPAGLDQDDRVRLESDVASLALLHGGTGLGALGRRTGSSVVVLGARRVGAPLAALLVAAGVGDVQVRDEGRTRGRDTAVGGLRAEDLGRGRGNAATARLREVSATTRNAPTPRPAVVVLAPAAGLDGRDALSLRSSTVPHLLAEVRDTVGVVGPLVLPGRSACLRCLDLARTDRDPDWPALAVQLADRPSTACDAVLAASVSAQAALQVLSLLDGLVPAAVDGSLELSLPDWRWRRRSWSPHPDCDCRWQAA